jgi:hypothetical protein
MQRRSTTQDVSWFLDMKRSNQLDMSPPYQRRSVWNPTDRRFFLDTIFRGYPCPPVFLHKTITEDGRTVYAVVDGKQRLETLFRFADGGVAISPEFGDARFDGRTFARLEQPEKEVFWNYVIPVEFLTFSTDDMHEVNQAFDRLNRNMRKLEAQELRHARWDGWFIRLAERECEDPRWRALGTVTTARHKRMKDAQFISELLLVIINNSMIGFDQDALDAAYARYDDLDEVEEALDEEDVMQKLNDAKEYVVAMQNSNGCVRDHASQLAAFYTLWAAVALHREALPEPADFAAIFTTFRRRVDELDRAQDKTPFITGENAPRYRRPSEFLEAFRGASTDLAPRSRRLEALLNFVAEGGE